MTNPFEKYLPSTLGFDHVFDVLDRTADIMNNTQAFPPVNIIRDDDNKYTVEIAVAGYNEDEIEVSVERNKLIVSGRKLTKDERKYIVKSIAGRTFSRTFLLADSVIVNNADLNNGILVIKLENVVPETHKSRKIVIGKASNPEYLAG